MPQKKQITKAERRHRDSLRRGGLRVAGVYQGRLEKARRKELRRVLELAMDYQVDALADVIQENIDESGYLPGWWQGLWTTIGTPYAQDVAKMLREEKAAQEADVWTSQLKRYATTRAGNEIRIVSGTWKDSLVDIIRRNLDAEPGIGIEKLTRQIYEDYRMQLERWQCRRIAQTEGMIGMAEAGDVASRTLDVPFTKQWVISGLGNTRASHEAMDGVEVDQDEPFSLPGGLMMYPHDTSMGADAGEIINCACDVIRRPKAGRQMQTAQQATTPITADEKRIQELMKDYADRPKDVQRALAENDLALEKEFGITKGKPMTPEKADKQSANPNYVAPYIEDPKGLFRDADGTIVKFNPLHTKADVQYEINCVTCANTFVLRERGFEITAKGRIANSGSLNDKAAEGFNMFSMWMTPDKKRVVPTDMRSWMGKKKYKSMTQGRYKEFFEEACKEPGNYLTSVGWGKVNGHATILHRAKDGKLYYIEPQSYIEKKGAFRDPAELYKRATSKPRIVDGVLRVDDLVFDTHWAGLFNTK